MAATKAAADLLGRFQPRMRYDSLESYFADSAGEWTGNPHNKLRRAGGEAVRIGAGHELSLDLLGKERYADGNQVEEGDLIESEQDDYGEQYVALRRAYPEFRNVVYGRAVRSHGRLWLQYWFFYFLNDYQLAWGIDVHEGDWEMVQLRLEGGGSEPEIAVYAQHAFCEVRSWADVEKDEGRPVVYVGRGSHASFFTAGYHPTAFYDVTDGKRHPKVEPRLEIVGDEPPRWLEWPGFWGGARAGAKGPGGPCRHEQWDEPEKLLEKEAVTPPGAPRPDEPKLWARRRRNRLLLEFDFSKMPEPPRRLVATVNSEDEPDVPPHTFRFGLRTVVLGSLQSRVELEPQKHYDVSLAVVDGQGRPTTAQLSLFGPSTGLQGLIHRLGAAAGRLVHLARLAFFGGE
jgi:hypothetical protein